MTDVTCIWGGGLTMALEWTNAESYETILIEVTGIEVAEIDGSDTAADIDVAEAGAYSAVIIADDPVLDCESSSEPCVVEVGRTAICDFPVEFVIDTTEDTEFHDLECFVD